ncbi:MAG: glutathione S-transferase family protein [SAR116 cluster bacterium]|nr:MAG: glutathione S-transferase family protein [SAR116 cluster bacterium]
MLLPIFHHYPQSPIAEKIRMTFGIMGMEWQSVHIPRIPPKPLLMPLTGGYRRTPVLQLGSDIFCDSQSIAGQLGLQNSKASAYQLSNKALELILGSFGETILFSLTVRVVLTSSMGVAPEQFIKDRGSLYFEPGWTVEEMRDSLPSILMQLQAAFDLINHHLLENGPFMNGDRPSYSDAVVQHCVWFLCGRFEGGDEFIEPFDAICKQRDLIASLGHGTSHDISAEQALETAIKNPPKAPKGINCTYTGGLKYAQKVKIRPNGRTSDPDVIGALRYLDETLIIIDYAHEDAGQVAIHFPVLGYQISAL